MKKNEKNQMGPLEGTGEDDDEGVGIKVSLGSLFRYATTTDTILMVVESLAAIANGIAVHLMNIYFGDIVQSFAVYDGMSRTTFDENVRLGVIRMVIVGVGAFLCSYIQMCFWVLAGENQTKRIRQEYFLAVLRQEVAWYDQNSSGSLVNRLTADMNLIQEGISDKVELLIQFGTTFVSGFVVGFIYGWRLALVITVSLPILAGVSMYLNKLMVSDTEDEQKAYAGAGDVALQVLSSIRTVVSFGAEESEAKRYSKQLDEAEKFGIKKAFINGIGTGFIQFLSLSRLELTRQLCI